MHAETRTFRFMLFTEELATRFPNGMVVLRDGRMYVVQPWSTHLMLHVREVRIEEVSS